MASAGGHWLKISGGPFTGQMAFSPAISPTVTHLFGKDLETLKAGQLVAVHSGSTWYLHGTKPSGAADPDKFFGSYKTAGEAMGQAVKMNELGYSRAHNTLTRNKINDAAKTTELKGKPAASPKVAKAAAPDLFSVGAGQAAAVKAPKVTASTSKLPKPPGKLTNSKSFVRADISPMKAPSDTSFGNFSQAHKEAVAISAYHKMPVAIYHPGGTVNWALGRGRNMFAGVVEGDSFMVVKARLLKNGSIRFTTKQYSTGDLE